MNTTLPWWYKTIDLRELTTHPYAWPGGYARYAICDDGDALCVKCVEENHEEVHTDEPNDGWRIVALDHTGNTDEPPTCAHCNKEIQ
jgi:hypothetical protein